MFRRSKFLYILVFTLASSFFINTTYGQEWTSDRVLTFLKDKLPVRLIGGVNTFRSSSFSKKRTNDTIPFSFIRKDQKNVYQYLISGKISVAATKISISLSDTLVLNYKKWSVSPSNRISFTPSGILVTDFLLNNDSAKITLNSRQDTANSPVDITIQNFNIRDINGIFSEDSLVASGLLDASVLVNDFGKEFPRLMATGSIRKSALMLQPIGTLQLNAQTIDKKTIHATIDLNENGKQISADGNIYIKNGLQQLDAALDIKKLPLAFLQGFMKGKVSGATGNVNGIIALKGKFSRPEWKGALNFDSNKFSINQFGTTYAIDKQVIAFNYPSIDFNQFTIKDSLTNSFIIDGKIRSDTIKGYSVAIALNARDFGLINAPRAINNQLYGYSGIDANVSVAGNMTNPKIAGDIYLNKKTKINLVLPEKNIDKDAARLIVRFIDKDTFLLPEPGVVKPAPEVMQNFEQYLNHHLNIHANKETELSIIIDPSTGDELKVQGNLLLNPGIDSGGNVLIAGNYLLDTGYYELSYEFLRKRFNVRKGSTINFGGATGDAKINIVADYIANTSPKDLLGNEAGALSATMTRSLKQDIPFKVILYLKGSLKNPAISFDIQLPKSANKSSRLTTTIENKLVQLRADIAATNKQVFALLGLGRFVGEQSADFFKGNGGDFSDLARESVSKFLSAALDQVASDLFKGINVDLNLNSYKDFTSSEATEKTNLNVEVSKNFLNDRLTVTMGKNFGIESQDASAKASQQKASRFLPDVTVNYKLSTDGKYMIRSYRKSPFEVILDGYVVETGLAFIITMDYEKFKDLFIQNSKKASP